MASDSPDELRNEAYRLYQAGDQAGAERLCHQLLQQQPRNFEAIHLLGAIAQGSGDFERAISLFSQAGELAPDNAVIANAQGEACFTLGRREEARVCFQRALLLRPTYERAHNNLGRLLHSCGELTAHKACFAEAIRLNPRYATALNNQGAVLQRKGNSTRRPRATGALWRLSRLIRRHTSTWGPCCNPKGPRSRPSCICAKRSGSGRPMAEPISIWGRLETLPPRSRGSGSLPGRRTSATGRCGNLAAAGRSADAE